MAPILPYGQASGGRIRKPVNAASNVAAETTKRQVRKTTSDLALRHQSGRR
jgi:hypothetical protein